MDENPTAPVANDSPAPAEPTTPVEPSTPEPSAPDAPAEQPQPSEPTGPPPETPDTDTPDRGVDPDKGIDPDKGDTPEKSESELKGMTRAERKEYFESLSQQSRKSIEQAIDSVYQAQPVDQIKEGYLEQGYSEFEATQLARADHRDQKEQINEARAEIAELNSAMQTQAIEVITTIPWLNSENDGKGYDKASTEAASKLYDSLAVVRDERTGAIVEAKISPKEFYTLIDKIRSSGAHDAELKARKAAEKEMASVAPPSSVTNKRDSSFESLSPSEMKAQLLAKGIAVT
jgi:hypothetical protein